MNRVSLVEFRRNLAGIIERVRKGERILLTRRGRAVLRLEPVSGPEPDADDPIYHLAELAVDDEDPLCDRDIDRIVYGL